MMKTLGLGLGLAFAAMSVSLLGAQESSDQWPPASKVISYLKTLENQWYNQSYLCRVKTAKVDSPLDLNANQLTAHGIALLALSGDRMIDETFMDRLTPQTRTEQGETEARWLRRHEIETFDGEQAYQWNDFANEGIVRKADFSAMFNSENAVYIYYGYLLQMPLSQLIEAASDKKKIPGARNEFQWEKVENLGEDQCLVANCIFRLVDEKDAVTHAERVQSWMAAQGAFYPMQIIKWVDEGDGQGEKIAETWESAEVLKDPQTHVWHLVKGRHLLVGLRQLNELEVLGRRPLDSAQLPASAFQLKFPEDARVKDMIRDQMFQDNYKSGVLHPGTTFLPAFTNWTFEDALRALNQTYTAESKFTPEWETQ